MKPRLPLIALAATILTTPAAAQFYVFEDRPLTGDYHTRLPQKEALPWKAKPKAHPHKPRKPAVPPLPVRKPPEAVQLFKDAPPPQPVAAPAPPTCLTQLQARAENAGGHLIDRLTVTLSTAPLALEVSGPDDRALATIPALNSLQGAKDMVAAWDMLQTSGVAFVSPADDSMYDPDRPQRLVTTVWNGAQAPCGAPLAPKPTRLMVEKYFADGEPVGWLKTGWTMNNPVWLTR